MRPDYYTGMSDDFTYQLTRIKQGENKGKYSLSIRRYGLDKLDRNFPALQLKYGILFSGLRSGLRAANKEILDRVRMEGKR